jgi:hypothetical protein
MEPVDENEFCSPCVLICVAQAEVCGHCDRKHARRVLTVSDASAFTCMRGAYRAGCVSRYGAVGIGPNGAMAVGRSGNVYAYRRGSGCFWRNGQRICL